MDIIITTDVICIVQHQFQLQPMLCVILHQFIK